MEVFQEEKVGIFYPVALPDDGFFSGNSRLAVF